MKHLLFLSLSCVACSTMLMASESVADFLGGGPPSGVDLSAPPEPAQQQAFQQMIDQALDDTKSPFTPAEQQMIDSG